MATIDYENYSKTCYDYDKFRTAFGWPAQRQELDILAERLNIPLSELVVLDAGCGSGLYTEELRHLVNKVIAVDQNDSMLTRCKEKFHSCENVEIFNVNLVEKFPIPSESVHAVTINQVLHHLETDRTAWPNTRFVFQEIHRVLRPGGLFAITHCTKDQTLNGRWYTDLVPAAVTRMADKYMTVEKLTEVLGELGFGDIKSLVTHEDCFNDDLLSGKDLSGLKNILSPEYRNAESVWSLSTPEEIKQASEKLERIVNSEDRGKAFLDERIKLKNKFGIATVTICYKS